MAIALSLHVLAAIVWVGGMFFAYLALRPVAASLLDPPLRLALWSQVFARFFLWVWLAVVLLPASGYWMLFARLGGFAHAGLHVHLMQLVGWVMIALFLYLYFAPYRRLERALADGRVPEAAQALNSIRRIVATNLALGLATSVIGVGGRWL